MIAKNITELIGNTPMIELKMKNICVFCTKYFGLSCRKNEF